MKIFSYCIYGHDGKYYWGLQENIRLISVHFPDYSVYLYVGRDYSKELLEEATSTAREGLIRLFYTNGEGGRNTLYRYLPLLEDGVELLFVRDTDSEVNMRDRWCIHTFLKSKYNTHAIRDHYWHKSPIMAGTSGFKYTAIQKIKPIFARHFEAIKKIQSFNYGRDEIFLKEYIHPLIKHDIMVHTNINAFRGEKYYLIEYENDNTNFVGNVVLYDSNGDKKYRFRYWDFPILDQVKWLMDQRQFQLINEVTRNIPDGQVGAEILDCIYIANYNLKDISKCRRITEEYEFTDITQHTIERVDLLFSELRKNHCIVAVVGEEYSPEDNEIAIYYGNYPITYKMFPWSNKVYWNAMYFNTDKHDKVICNSSWRDIDQIYVLNLEERTDRYIEVMCELARMGAPLHKVFHYKAKKDACITDAYIGVTLNHLAAMENMMEHNYKTCLVVEDDIVFTSQIKQHLDDLEIFFERKYVYDICFLAASRFHKRQPYDDLLILSKQACTTSAAYLLNGDSVRKVYECVKEGCQKLRATGDPNRYCIDRYWSKLQGDDKVFIFKRKMCYQRPNYSNLKRSVAAFLD